MGTTLDDHEEPLSLVLFSGTDDKLNAAAVLTVGAAAMGRPVNVFLQYYALDAFRAGQVCVDHALSAEATDVQAPAVRAHPVESTSTSPDSCTSRSARNMRLRCSASRRGC
ncbi:MAG: DsrE/DsrF/DrsH-like family protein [Candidatus Dormiibacterota bacterium]